MVSRDRLVCRAPDLDAFAAFDGFSSFSEMVDFWAETHFTLSSVAAPALKLDSPVPRGHCRRPKTCTRAGVHRASPKPLQSTLLGHSASRSERLFLPLSRHLRRGSEYDPRVRTRIERASGMTAVEYIQLRAARADFVARVAVRTAGFDALLMPTVAITAPPIAAFEWDEDYRRLNALLLRNTSIINFLDCCAITVPIQTAGPPVGLMIVDEHGADRHLLAVGRAIEVMLNRTH
jgi:hypothetical protein